MIALPKQARRREESVPAWHDRFLPDVRVLEGGMPTWLHRGYPAESGTCHGCDIHE